MKTQTINPTQIRFLRLLLTFLFITLAISISSDVHGKNRDSIIKFPENEINSNRALFIPDTLYPEVGDTIEAYLDGPDTIYVLNGGITDTNELDLRMINNDDIVISLFPQDFQSMKVFSVLT